MHRAVGQLTGSCSCVFAADSGSTLAVAELDIAMMDSELQRW